MRDLWRRIHLWLALAAGLVLSLMGITGALMSFEDEIMAAASPGIVTIAPRTDVKLSPDTLLARLRESRPDLLVVFLEIDARPERANRVWFAAASGERASRQVLWVDPYDARILGEPRGAAFFATVRRLHRWLLLPGDGTGPGRQITGAATLCLLVLLVSGFYLRWPAQPRRWRVWFRLDLARPGRMRHFSLHAKVATWVLPIYLISALSGLWWSYDWYRAGATYLLTGKLPQRAPAAAPGGRRAESPAPARLDPAWQTFLAGPEGRFRTVLITVPAGPGDIRIRSLAEGAPNQRARDDARYDQKTGALKGVERYADRRLGEAIAGNMLELHRGRFFGLVGSILTMLASALMPLFATTGLLLYLGRLRGQRRNRTASLAAGGKG